MPLARRSLLGTLTYASLVLSLSTCEMSKVLSTPAARKVVLSFPDDSTLIMGSGLKPSLQITIDGDPIIDPEVRFASSDTSVIAIGPHGDSLIARKLGAATITATLQGTLLPDPRPSASDTIYVVPKEFTITPAAITFTSLGDSATLTAIALDANNQVIPNVTVTWQSSDPAAVSVSVLGVLVAKNNTTALTTVSARLAGITVTAPVTVVQQLDHFVFTPSRQTLDAIGATVTLTAGGRDRRGNDIAGITGLQWQSGNGGVLSVTSAGVVTALDNGLSFVRVSRGPVSDTVDVDVEQVATNVDIVTPAGAAINAVGGTLRLVARSFDRRAIEVRQKKASWLSLDGNVARVDTTGVVEGLGAGTARIVARVDAVAETLTVAVSDDPAEIQVSPPTASLTSVGAVLQLSVAVRNALGAPIPAAAVSWRTPDGLVASVSATGQVQALNVGIARIIATSGTTADTATVTISNLPDQVNILLTAAVLASANDSLVPEVAVFNALGAPLPATSLQWSSEDPAVARVTSAGIIIATGAGSAWVKAANPANLSRRDSILITVTNAPASVVLSAATDVLTAVGRTRTYSGEVRNARGALIPGAEIVWNSTNILVATVSGGFVTARGAGDAMIIGASGGKADTVALTVTNAAVSLEILPATATISTIGDTLTTLRVLARNELDDVIPGVVVSWRTPDPSLAEVLADGRVVALAVGSARVIATVGAVADTVTVALLNVADVVNLAPSALTMGSVLDQDTPAITVENARGVALGRSAVTWTTDDPLVARVSLSGTITAIGAGTTFIKAVSPGNPLRRDSVEVTVTNAPFTVVLNAETDVITAVGRTRSYFAEVRNAAGALLVDHPVAFRSTATSVATVIPSTGAVTAMGTGSTLIIAQAGTKADTIALQVLNTPLSVDLTPAVAEITSLNDVIGLQAAARNDLDELIPNPDLSWRSVDETVATVNSLGQVTGVAIGTTKIIVTAGTHADTTVLTVSNHPAQIDILVDAVALTSLEDSIAPAATIKNGLGATLPRTAATWSSDDPSIARVSSNGMIVARDVGTTIVRATSGSVTDVVSVVVTNAPATVVLDAVRDTLTKTGQILGYTATARNGANAIIPNPGVTWTSTASGFASVSPTTPGATTANATALANGTTLIIASAGSGVGLRADTATLVVTNPTRIYVDNSSVATPRVGTLARPFARIQDAVNAADPLDIVIVKQGNAPYGETVNIAKVMTVTGDSAAFVAAPVGSRDPSLLPLISHDTGTTGVIVGAAGATIRYLTLRHTLDGPAIDATNGNLSVDWFYVNVGLSSRTGRGIWLKNPPSAATIRNVFVSSVFGYGVRIEGASNATVSAATITRVDSVSLTAYKGAGIEVIGGSGNKVELSRVRNTEGPQIQLTSSSAKIRQNDLAGRHQLIRITAAAAGTSVDTNTFTLSPQPEDPAEFGSVDDNRSALEISLSSSVKVNGNTFNEGIGSRFMDGIRLITTTQSDSVGGTSTSLVGNHFIGGRYSVHSTGSKWDMQKSRSQGADYVVYATSGDVISLLDDTLTSANLGCVRVRGSGSRFYSDRVQFDNCVPASASNAVPAIDIDGTGAATRPVVRVTQSSFRGPNQTAITLLQGSALLMVEDTLLGQPSTALFGSTTLGAVHMTQVNGTDSLRLSGNVIRGYPEIAAVNAGGGRLTMLNNVLTANKFGLRSNGWSGTLTFQDNEIFDNDTAGVFHTVNGTLTISDTWWGDPRGVRKAPTASPTSAGDSTIATSGTVSTTVFRTTPVPLITASATATAIRPLRNINTNAVTTTTVAVSVRVIDAAGRPVPFKDVVFSCDAPAACALSTGPRRLLNQPQFGTVSNTASTRTVQTDASGMAEILLQLVSVPPGNTVVRAALSTNAAIFTTVTVDH